MIPCKIRNRHIIRETWKRFSDGMEIQVKGFVDYNDIDSWAEITKTRIELAKQGFSEWTGGIDEEKIGEQVKQ